MPMHITLDATTQENGQRLTWRKNEIHDAAATLALADIPGSTISLITDDYVREYTYRAFGDWSSRIYWADSDDWTEVPVLPSMTVTLFDLAAETVEPAYRDKPTLPCPGCGAHISWRKDRLHAQRCRVLAAVFGR